MKKISFLILFLACVTSTVMAASVWNPAANPESTGLWSEAPNWTSGAVPGVDDKVVFNVPEAPECKMDIQSSIKQLVMGDGNMGETLRIINGGSLTTTAGWSAIGYNNTSTLVVDTGGVITFGEHMWIGLASGSDGTVILNGGTINVTQMIGVGWDGGKGSIHVNSGLLNLANIHPTNSIKEESVIDITAGEIIIAGDHVEVIMAYVEAGKIKAYGGEGTVTTYMANGSTHVVASAKERGGSTVWNPAGNAATTGLWSDGANWTDGNIPLDNKVVFNVPEAQECVMNISSTIKQLVMGDGNIGETLRVTAGGNLTTTAGWSAVGYNNTATLVVDTGGVVTFGEHMWIGLAGGSDGTVILNGGTINVTAMTAVGWDGGKGTVHINGGLFNLANIHPENSIKEGSLIDITAGMIKIAGDHVAKIDSYISLGRLTAYGGEGAINVMFDGTSTVVTASATPRGASTVWNPAGNAATTGMWSEGANWNDGNIPQDNKVVFNVPEAQECVMNISSTIKQLVMGDGNIGETLRVTAGGNLTTTAGWSAVGYNNTATLKVDSGGVVTFGEHMWIGLAAGSDGTVILNGGTINVTAMTAVGWDGGKGTVHVNGGLFNLANIHPENSIKEGSLIDITAGTIQIAGDHVAKIDSYISLGRLTAYGGTGTVMVELKDDVTIVTASEDAMVKVTFNMNSEKATIADGDVFYVTGAFSDWSEPGTEGSVLLAATDGIYTGSIYIADNTGEIAYKYFQNAGWNNGDLHDGGGNNGDRLMTIGTDDIVNDDIWYENYIPDAIYDFNEAKMAKVFYNSSKDAVRIKNAINLKNVEIYNIYGQRMVSIAVNGMESHDISAANLNSGVYVVRMKLNSNEIQSAKFVK